MNVIIPVAVADVETVLKNIPYIKRNIMPSEIIIITGSDAISAIKRKNIENILLFDENKMIEGLNFNVVKKELEKYNAEGRTGWYFQQFLKLGYSLICEDEYYISWDSDTIPIRNISMFENGKPIFDIKTEHHQPYFDTIKELFGFDKIINGSFISEHMLFKTEYVKQMINCLNIDKEWFIRIIEAINPRDIGFSGFSEFETYGTFVSNVFPNSYGTREIRSFRDGRIFFGDIPSPDVLSWMAKSYSTISFEKWQKKKLKTNIYNKRVFRRLISPSLFIFFSKIIIRIKQKYVSQ